MMRKRRLALASLASFAILLTLGGCGSLSLEPANVTLNGYTIDQDTGTVNFNLSAFDYNDELITSGTVSQASVVVTRATDAAGNPLSNVSAEAQVCGDITSHEAIVAVITLDATGSMADNDPTDQRNDAAKSFIDRLGPGDLAAVASFDTDTAPSAGFYAIHVWQDFTDDKESLYAAVDQATFAGGGTNLWDAVVDDVNLLATSTSDAEKVALVLTDGEDTDSFYTAADAASYAKDHGAKVYMIGLGDPNTLDFSEMQYVASETGGLFAAASDPDQLSNMFDGMFNASKASFCIAVRFSVNGAPPAPGTTISGILSFAVNGSSFDVDFTVTF